MAESMLAIAVALTAAACSFVSGHARPEPLQAGEVSRARLLEEAPRIRQEVVELLDAPQCGEGTLDVILASSQMALQIHESCGHPTELDRALGEELSLAGGSLPAASTRQAAYGPTS
jgi:predicted Zn-dependent protease